MCVSSPSERLINDRETHPELCFDDPDSRAHSGNDVGSIPTVTERNFLVDFPMLRLQPGDDPLAECDFCFYRAHRFPICGCNTTIDRSGSHLIRPRRYPCQ